MSPLATVCPNCAALHLGRGRCPTCERHHNAERNAQPHRRAHRTARHRRLRAYVFHRDNHRCVDCGTGEDLTLDYLTPLQHGGEQVESNATTRCRACNARRGAR